MKKCYVSMSTMTLAQKARNILALSKIKANVVKLTVDQSYGGCSWGVETDCDDQEKIRRILDISDIPGYRFIRGKE